MASEPSKQPRRTDSAPATPAPASSEAASKPPAGKTPALFRPIDWLACALTTLLVFCGYMYTLAPDMTLQDSGELAVASMYAGVPHPPGYPVWTIYTWIFTKIIPFGNIAWRVGISSAFAGALTCGLIALMVSRGGSMLMESIAEFRNIPRRTENAICIVTGFVSGMLIGFNGFMWSQSIIVEVYALTMLSLVGVLVCLLRWVHGPHQYRYLYFAWFLCGISFNNHQSLLVITLAMVALTALVQAKVGREFFFWSALVYLAGAFLQLKGDISILQGNGMILLIYHLIGLALIGGWIYLSVKTKLQFIEFVRNWIVLGIVGGFFGVIAWMMARIGSAAGVLSLLVLIGTVVAYWMIRRQTLPLGRHWSAALTSGVAFAAGAAFYLYMPLASMTNPPLNWGYPRTVAGFVHAFTRGQYERIHPTSGEGNNIITQTGNFVSRYAQQVWYILVEGPIEEFNLIYTLFAFVPLFFLRRLQARERAWLIGLVAFYIVLGPFLLELFNPAPDRQSLSLNKPFFIASHVILAMAIGYGLTLLIAELITAYNRFRVPVLIAFTCIAGFAGYHVFSVYEDTPYNVLRWTAIVGFIIAFLAVLSIVFARNRAPVVGLLTVFALMPLWPMFGHWSENEQRNHFYGYWFGHDMFTPPFKNKEGKLVYDKKQREEIMQTPEGKARTYPEMTRDAILFGGTDPGRFCPTYMIFCESFIPAKDKPRDPDFDRRDVYIITQNALADGTYLQYIRGHYFVSDERQYDTPFFQELFRSEKERQNNFKTNFLARAIAAPLDNLFANKIGMSIEMARRERGVYPPKEIYTPTPEDSSKCFQEYMADAQGRMAKGQLKPGEDVKVQDGKVQVSGQVAVMAINGLLTKVIFEKNPNHEFFVEESFPLDWMYPHLTPFGIIMKINRQPLPELTQDIVFRDHEFWSDFSTRLIGNWITYDTPVSNIVTFAERRYLRKDFKDFTGDPRFVRDDDGQKAFSKLRSSIAGLYAERLRTARSAQESERMFKEAEFSFKQAYAFCPYSPEALYRYVNLLAGVRRFDDALMLAQTSYKLDPGNSQLLRLVEELKRLKDTANTSGAPAVNASLQKAEADYAANKSNFSLAVAYAQEAAKVGDVGRVTAVADDIIANPNADATMVQFAMQIFAQPQIQNFAKLEQALKRWTKLSPGPESWLDLAGAQAMQNKNAEAITSLKEVLALNAARRKANPNASNIVGSIESDPRLGGVRALPEYRALMATNK
ncbi:MAG TPA: DUF2723 domain-containing protein [Candidatus Acidoferrum sp.]|nr:DUF2723 domain-containing protein [Candidatus Acidoferrum sp.]